MLCVCVWGGGVLMESMFSCKKCVCGWGGVKFTYNVDEAKQVSSCFI